MPNSLKKITKNIFSNSNVLAISITNALWRACSNGWRPYWPLYLKQDLGASIAMIGILSTIQLASQLFFQIPGGVLADKIGRKKVIVVGTVIRLFPPIIYLLATNWIHVVPALLIEALRSIYQPAVNAIIADSLPPKQRGTGYGAYRMITTSPRLIMPIIGGIAMDAMGYKKGIKVFLIANIIAILVALYIRAKFIKETLVKKEQQMNIKKTIYSVFDVPRTIWVIVLFSAISSFALRIVMPFINIYAIEIIGLTNTQLGLVETSIGFLSTFLSVPGGMLADRVGRKPIILFTSCITPLTRWGIIFVSGFWQYLLLQSVNSIGMIIGGAEGVLEMVAGPAWEALVADLVPREKRGTIRGIIDTFTLLVGAPSSWIGGYIWQYYTPQAPFQLSLILGILGVLIFSIFVQEPIKREE